jgi:hypothetical protein
MTVYAMIVTFILGALAALISLYSYLSYQDGKALKLIEEEERRRHAAWRRQVRAELEDEDMKRAEELVRDKLDATILSYEEVN